MLNPRVEVADRFDGRWAADRGGRVVGAVGVRRGRSSAQAGGAAAAGGRSAARREAAESPGPLAG